VEQPFHLVVDEAGPGMTRSWPDAADATVSVTAPQSEITTPSKPHSSFSGEVSSSFAEAATPLTRLYDDMIIQAPDATARSNGAR
jgi:hypothetical protein